MQSNLERTESDLNRLRTGLITALDFYLETGLFERLHPDDHNYDRYLRLKGTRYYIFYPSKFFGQQGTIWREVVNCRLQPIDFEDLFEVIPEEVQMKLLYHLDWCQ